MRQRNPIEGKAVKDCPNGPENGDPRRVAIPGRRTEIDPRDTIERKEASRVQKLINRARSGMESAREGIRRTLRPVSVIRGT